MSEKRVHLHTLGCRLNEAEIESWARDFRQLGWQVVEQPDMADLLIVNTCAVTGEATRKSRQLLRRSRRSNPAAKLVLSGCFATLEGRSAAQELGVDLVVDNAHKDRLVEQVSRALDWPAALGQTGETTPTASPIRRRQRAFVKVQDGCRHRCSYCVVTLARGPERSRAAQDVVREINQLHASGIQEVVLAGVHLGGYGQDIGSHLGGLIDAILVDTSIPRVRLGSLEPWNLYPEFWERFTSGRLMPHLHLPLQSGSDTVLRRMARRCRSADFRTLVDTARRFIPDLNITTDIIVGFPGETDAEWQETLDIVTAMGFGDIHIFGFSPRAGTKAASLPDPVVPAIKQARSEQLHAIALEQRREQLNRFLDRDLDVLIERKTDASHPDRWIWTGYTPNYLKVIFEASAGVGYQNRIVSVHTQRVDRAAGALRARACGD